MPAGHRIRTPGQQAQVLCHHGQRPLDSGNMASWWLITIQCYQLETSKDISLDPIVWKPLSFYRRPLSMNMTWDSEIRLPWGFAAEGEDPGRIAKTWHTFCDAADISGHRLSGI
jgi:hypothetical protein